RGARIHAAEKGVELKRLQVEDALREIVYAVRSAYADVLREQNENQLSRDVRDRYSETIRLSRARRAAGEISEAELRKIELEGLRYTTAVVDADMQLDLSRARLAGLMGLPPAEADKLTLSDPGPARAQLSLAAMTQQALEQPTDIRAVRAAQGFAEANLGKERREALPDISLGVTFTHSEFT